MDYGFITRPSTGDGPLVSVAQHLLYANSGVLNIYTSIGSYRIYLQIGRCGRMSPYVAFSPASLLVLSFPNSSLPYIIDPVLRIIYMIYYVYYIYTI